MSGGSPIRSTYQTASVATAPSPNIIMCGRAGVCFIQNLASYFWLTIILHQVCCSSRRCWSGLKRVVCLKCGWRDGSAGSSQTALAEAARPDPLESILNLPQHEWLIQATGPPISSDCTVATARIPLDVCTQSRSHACPRLLKHMCSQTFPRPTSRRHKALWRLIESSTDKCHWNVTDTCVINHTHTIASSCLCTISVLWHYHSCQPSW